MKPISSFATISSTAIRERWQHERQDNAVVNKFLALVLGSKTSFNSFAVLPGSAREPISALDVEHRVIAIGNDVDPEVVITGHHSELKCRDVSTSLDMTNKTLIRVIRG
jgi:hypothetical protein